MPQNATSTSLLNAEELHGIEHEHDHLEQIMRHLLDTCGKLASAESCDDCTREQRAVCQGRLPSLLYDLVDCTAEHFEHEEGIMRSKPGLCNDAYFHRHQAAYALLLRDLADIVARCNAQNHEGNAKQAIRDLHNWVHSHFTEHIRHFDMRLLVGHEHGNHPSDTPQRRLT